MTPRQRHREEVMRAFARRDGTVVCALAHRGWCNGVIQPDHVIEVRWLDQARNQAMIANRLRGRPSPLLDVEADDLVADARNGWPLCERHHTVKTAAALNPPPGPDELPPSVFDFVRAYDLDDLLARVCG